MKDSLSPAPIRKSFLFAPLQKNTKISIVRAKSLGRSVSRFTPLACTDLFLSTKSKTLNIMFKAIKTPIQCLLGKSLQLKVSLSTILLFAMMLGSFNTASAQANLNKQNDFLTEKKQMIKNQNVDQKLELSKKDIEFIEVNVKQIKVQIEKVKKAAKKAKIFNEEEKYQALENKLIELRQLASDFKMIKTKTLIAI